jgi:hypothetical protein
MEKKVTANQVGSSFSPKIEIYDAFEVPFSGNGKTTKEMKQIDACCACTACSACTACG